MKPLQPGTYGGIILRVVSDKQAVAEDFARTMVDVVKANNALGKPTRFIMPVGPTGQYRRFAELCAAECVDLAMLHVFHMDEYVGDDGANLPPDHQFSFARFLRDNFHRAMTPACRLNPAQTHIPDARNPIAYDAAIDAVGGIDVCFGGIGINGHLAFNEALDYWELMSPETFRNLPARVVKIAATTKVINAVFGTGGNLQAVPNFAVTVGMKKILAARQIRIYLDWPWQKQVLRNLLFGPVTPMFPASFLQEHGDVIVTTAACVAEDPCCEPE